MTALLLRLFVKDYQNPENPAVHTAIGKMAGITGVLCNVFLFLGKLLAGLLSGSISIVADAVNNLSDAGSSSSLPGGPPTGSIPTATPGMSTCPDWWWRP